MFSNVLSRIDGDNQPVPQHRARPPRAGLFAVVAATVGLATAGAPTATAYTHGQPTTQASSTTPPEGDLLLQRLQQAHPFLSRSIERKSSETEYSNWHTRINGRLASAPQRITKGYEKTDSRERDAITNAVTNVYFATGGRVTPLEMSHVVAEEINRLKRPAALRSALSSPGAAGVVGGGGALVGAFTPGGVGAKVGAGATTAFVGALFGNSINGVTAELEKENEYRMRRAATPDRRTYNLRVLEHLAEERPELYDAVAATVQAYQKHKLPLAGINLETQREEDVGFPDRKAAARDEFPVRSPQSLLERGASSGLSPEEQASFNSNREELAKLDGEQKATFEAFLRAAVLERDAQDEFNKGQLGAEEKLEEARRATEEAEYELRRVTEESLKILERIDPKAAAIVGRSMNLANTLHDLSRAGLGKLKLSDFLSVTNLGFALFDAIIGGKDPNQVYYENLRDMISGLYDGMNGISNQISDLQEEIISQFAAVNRQLEGIRFDQQKNQEELLRELKAIRIEFGEALARIAFDVRETREIAERTSHNVEILLEVTEQLQVGLSDVMAEVKQGGLPLTIEKMKQALEHPGSSQLEDGDKRELLEHLVKDLNGVAGILSEHSWLKEEGQIGKAEVERRGAELLRSSRQARALALHFDLNDQEFESHFRALVDYQYFREGIELAVRASGREGFPRLSEREVARWQQFADRSQEALDEILPRVVSAMVDRLRAKTASFRKTTEDAVASPVALRGASPSAPGYSLAAPRKSLEASVDGSEPRSTLVANREFSVASLQASPVDFKHRVPNSHWYQRGNVKVKERYVSGYEHIEGSDRGTWVYSTRIVDRLEEKGSCGGEADVTWSATSEPTDLQLKSQRRDLDIGALALPSGLRKLQLLGEQGFNTGVGAAEHALRLELVETRPGETGLKGWYPSGPDVILQSGDSINFSYTQHHVVKYKPIFESALELQGPLMKVRVHFDCPPDHVPTAVKLSSEHRISYKLDDYITYLAPGAPWKGSPGLESEASRHRRTNVNVPHSGRVEEHYLHGNQTDGGGNITLYYEQAQQLLQAVAPVLLNSVRKERGEGWSDGLSGFTVSTTPVSNQGVGYREDGSGKFLVVKLEHRVDGSIYVNLPMGAEFVPPQLRPRFEVSFPEDLRGSRAGSGADAQKSATVQRIIDIEGAFHASQVRQRLGALLDNLEKPGAKLQQKHESLEATVALLRTVLQYYASGIIEHDFSETLRRGGSSQDSLQARLSGRSGSLMNLGRTFDTLRKRFEEKEQLPAEQLSLICDQLDREVTEVLEALQRATREGVKYRSPDLDRAKEILSTFE